MANKKERYVKKIIKEFTSKGWDTSSLMGRMKYENIINSESHYNKFKANVRKSRAYNREREQIKKEYTQIQKKFARNVNERNQRTYTKLLKQGLSPREARQTIMSAIEQNIPSGSILEKDIRGKVFQNKLISSLQHELELKWSDGSLKKIKGPFNRFYQEPFLKKHFQELERLAAKDPQQIRHMNILLDKFMGTIIPQAYGDRKGTSVEFKSPTSEFYMGLLDKLIYEYKVILKE